MATQAVAKVRYGAHCQLMTDNDDSLSKTEQVWLTSLENLTEKQQTHLRCSIVSSTPVRKGKRVQGNAPRSPGQNTAVSATTFFNDWSRRVIHTKLEPMKAVAKPIKERVGNSLSYGAHKITSAVAEGMNRKIMSIKRRVRGIRYRENFRAAILFYYGGGVSPDPQ